MASITFKPSGESTITLNSGENTARMQGTGPVRQNEYTFKTTPGFDGVVKLDLGKKDAPFAMQVTAISNPTNVLSTFEGAATKIGTLVWRSQTYSNVLLENVTAANWRDVIYNGAATKLINIDLQFKQLS